MRATSWSSLACVSALMMCVGACGPGEDPQPEPISIEITSPQASEVVPNQRVRVKGRAENLERLTVNGTEVAVVGGVFDVALDFEDGPAEVVAQSGETYDQVLFTVDSSSPVVTLTSPQRGVYVAGDVSSVTVSGTIEERGAGLELLKVGEQILSVGEDGAFTYEAPLDEGINALTVTAIDLAGNTSDVIVGVVRGDTVDATSPISPGFSFLVTPSAMESFAAVLQSVFTPEFVERFVNERFAGQGVVLTEVAFDPIEVSVVPKSNPVPEKPGFIDLSLKVSNATLGGSFDLNGNAIDLEVTIAEATVTTSVTLEVTPEGGLDFDFGESVLDLPEDSLSWKVALGEAELSNDDSSVLESLVENIAQAAFSELLTEEVFNTLYDPNLLKREVELFGRTLAFEISLTEIVTNATGMTIAADVTLPSETAPDVRDVPGALLRARGPRDAPAVDSDALVTTDRTTIDRLFHGVWAAGLLHQELEGANFAGYELPFELTAGALALLLDGRISNYASNTSPVGIALRPLIPPIATLDPGADESGAALGTTLAEFHIDVLLDSGSASATKLMTIAAFIDLGIDVQVEGTTISLGFDASARVDMVDEPLFDMDDEGAEELFEQLVALVPSVIADGLALGGEADLTWLILTDPTLQVHGLEKDQLTIGLDIEPNPDGVNFDEAP